MRLFRSVLLTTLAVAAPAAALAADMGYGRGPSLISEPRSTEEEIGTGWYLRGDIGYALSNKPKVSFTDASTRLSNATADNAMTFGGGFGYKFDNFRVDLTADAINNRKVGWNRSAGCYGLPCLGGAPNVGKQTFTAILANAYYDVGQWAGLTPYVGAGIGVAYGGMAIDGYVSPNSSSTLPSDTYTNYYYSSHQANRFSLAAAAMAGASYNLGGGIMLDAGYRFLWVDNSASGQMSYKSTTVTNPDIDGKGGGTVVTGGQAYGRVKFEDLKFQQFRVGLRYFVN